MSTSRSWSFSASSRQSSRNCRWRTRGSTGGRAIDRCSSDTSARASPRWTCAVYFAVDLLDPDLRVIEHQALERAEDADHDPGRELAYVNGEVPADVRHWFVVASPSLFDWLERWLDHGVVSSRYDWQ